jgi:hypothetical protein
MTRQDRIDRQPAPTLVGARRSARPVTDAEVQAALAALCDLYHAPSTSLITWQLAGDARVTARFQSAVRNSLQQLHARGRISCVVHRGTYRWSTLADEDRVSA